MSVYTPKARTHPPPADAHAAGAVAALDLAGLS